ncbi:RagB/SusD family nutrient uptake outer membrane protein [Parasediminibacterium sp. JCM 36343]|uniref:RagB/SusD family nutrient uptake outer membrane protein n=1 Tax=Parasediminibacterium sp. JCM 36343 TaxID=3374279 RepID=UPI00397B7F93
MNKFFVYIITMGCLLAMASCNKILDTKPDFAQPTQYYQTETQLNDALAGIYSVLASTSFYGDAYLAVLNTGNDESWYRSTTVVGPPVYTFNAGDANITSLWQNLYDGINMANALLENINKPQMDEKRRAEIKGEAFFLRGYYYFMLVQHWGDVPLKLSSTTLPSSEQYTLPRTPAKAVYAQVIADMAAADSTVDDISAIGFSGRVSKTTVEGILARVCLYMAGQPVNDVSKYADAVKWATKVVASRKHSLNPDYKQIFINECQNAYDTKEAMWEVEFLGNSTAATGGSNKAYGYLGIRVGVQCSNLDSGYCYGFLYGMGLLYKSFDANDLRRDWVLAPYNYSGDNKVPLSTTEYYKRYPGKWRREYEQLKPKVKNACGTNFPILRYADVLLMLAEAENEVNGPANALQYLDTVRTRAGLKAYIPTDAAVSSQANFRVAIQNERYKELAFECLRTMDLIRWGLLLTNTKNAAADVTLNASTSLKYGATAAANITARNILWPIPTYELSLNNNLTQNKGW